MGHSERLFADTGGLTGGDIAQLANDGLAPPRVSGSAPIHGFVLRHGQPMPFTLDASQFAPETRCVVPEQIAIAALVLASLIEPIYHLIG